MMTIISQDIMTMILQILWQWFHRYYDNDFTDMMTNEVTDMMKLNLSMRIYTGELTDVKKPTSRVHIFWIECS